MYNFYTQIFNDYELEENENKVFKMSLFANCYKAIYLYTESLDSSSADRIS